jgi:hypothetical protein
MRNKKAISQELQQARARVNELEDELRAASTIAYLAVFNESDRTHTIAGVSSELPTNHHNLSLSWDADDEAVMVEWQSRGDYSSMQIEVDETEEWFQDENVLMHVSAELAAAEGWIRRRLKN